jgi:NAD(P)-dependent dehydrogenase (short-subunit alcohol dehydrogenase family)
LKTIVITGVTGRLGAALARLYSLRGDEVIGITRKPDAKVDGCARIVQNEQRSEQDARALFADRPDLVILCAGAIEEEVGPTGLPIPAATRALYEVNAVFPSLVALAATAHAEARARAVDVVAIGSIADGMPSAFGPVYHASKIALHYFYQGVAPIAAPQGVRLRVYRPGVIRGPLAWAPLIRLNERGRRIRARRCADAPEAAVVAARVARWIDGDRWVGRDAEPLSFRALKLLFAIAPNAYARLQHVAWRKGSRFS